MKVFAHALRVSTGRCVVHVAVIVAVDSPLEADAPGSDGGNGAAHGIVVMKEKGMGAVMRRGSVHYEELDTHNELEVRARRRSMITSLASSRAATYSIATQTAPNISSTTTTRNIPNYRWALLSNLCAVSGYIAANLDFC
jgi:hypothetical protein